MRKIGFVVNPIAGIGGRVALKGSDGVVELARKLGGEPLSPIKAEIFIKNCKEILKNFEILTAAGNMGENYLKKFSLKYRVVYYPRGKETTAEDTIKSCKRFCEENAELIIFVGGDGTARDVMQAQCEIPVLGIPAGVKVYSAVFSISPEFACTVLSDYLCGNFRIEEREVVDIDEEAFRKNELRIKLHGYMKVLVSKDYVQNAKSPSAEGNKEEIAEYFLDEIMEKDVYYILGPGTTVKEICRILGEDCTLLGVDVMLNGKVVKRDCSERELISLFSEGKKVYIVVSPLGAQRTLFGRGNQQISPEIIKKVGRDNIIVLATPEKVSEGKLYVDTGDEETDSILRGYLKVVIGYGMWKMVRIV